MSDAQERVDAKSRLVSNERAKARATYLNALAVAVLAVGGLAPVATAVASSQTPSPSASLLVVVLSRGELRLTFMGDQGVEGSRTVMLQTLSLFIMPVGALALGLIVLYQARREAESHKRK